ncbi:MAG TPA: hypothetical protein DC049_09830 [Spirochaetia bacterium]|nr:hypothetical protein [Spirochaetia bacterium]
MGQEPDNFEKIAGNRNLLNLLSHQLKSPLSSITTLLSTIIQGYTGEITPKARQLLGKALDRSEEARNVITDLLDFEFYLEDSKNQKITANIIPVIKKMGNKFSASASAKNISIALDIPERLQVNVVCSLHGMEIILANLLENAVKYSPPNSKIIIRLGLEQQNRQGLLSVIDSGSGISAEDQKKIFEPFFRAIKHKSMAGGTGLGLSIVKKIIDDHGFSLKVDSAEGQGSSFIVKFDVSGVEEETAPEAYKKKILIIGGVTAGPKAAARLRRLDENLDITIIEKSRFLSYAGCGLPSFISGRVHSASALMSTADNTIRDVHFFEAIKNIRTMNKTCAQKIDRINKNVLVHDYDTGRDLTLSYDRLIIATGAVSRVPDISGIKSSRVYSLYNFEDAQKIRELFSKNPALDCYIIGGGLIGVETAESLITCGARVTILECRPRILSSLFDEDISGKIRNILSNKGIKIITGVNIREIKEKTGRLEIHTDHDSFSCDFVILSAGVVPNSELARDAGLETGSGGGIVVNEFLETSDPDIFAIGDCALSTDFITKKPVYLPLGSISTKMGRIAANNICGIKTSFTGSLSTAMFKVFELNAGRTGLTTAQAREHGYDPVSIIVSGLDRSHYAENARYVVLKLIADRKSKRLLGAQGFGEGDIVSRIELVSVCIFSCLTWDKLFPMDLGYHPDFNNPIDIIQVAGEMLSGKNSGFYRSVVPEAINEFNQPNIIDLSPQNEHAYNSIPGSINIPLESLRLENIPFKKDDIIILYSKTSSGAYEAYRYLAACGFTGLYVLEGGMYYYSI